jgi:hypothetical protein
VPSGRASSNPPFVSAKKTPGSASLGAGCIGLGVGERRGVAVDVTVGITVDAEPVGVGAGEVLGGVVDAGALAVGFAVGETTDGEGVGVLVAVGAVVTLGVELPGGVGGSVAANAGVGVGVSEGDGVGLGEGVGVTALGSGPSSEKSSRKTEADPTVLIPAETRAVAALSGAT